MEKHTITLNFVQVAAVLAACKAVRETYDRNNGSGEDYDAIVNAITSICDQLHLSGPRAEALKLFMGNEMWERPVAN